MVLGRTRAVVLTALGFVALKTVPGVGELAEPLLGGVTRRDPTDVLGLVALPLAWWRMGDAPEPRRPRPTSTTLSLRRDTTRRVGSILGGSVAVLAVTATSYELPPHVTELRVDDEGAVYARLLDVELDRSTWAVSTDGGTSWTSYDGGPPDEVGPVSGEACRTDRWCFRSVDDGIDERPPDGEWQESFAVTGDEEALIGYWHVRTSPDRTYDAAFGDVVVVSAADAEHVVVAALDQGVLVLDGDGEWQRRAVLDAAPTETSGVLWPLEWMEQLLWLVGPVALVAMALQATVGRRLGRNRVKPGAWFQALVVGGALWVLCGVAWGVLTWAPAPPTLAAVILAATAVLPVLVPVQLLRQSQRRSPMSPTPEPAPAAQP